MKVSAILEQYRSQTHDTAVPPLVADTQAMIYLNEAQTEACRRARLLVDSTTPDLAQLSVPAGSGLIDLSQKIISIRRCRLSSSVKPLVKMTVREMDAMFPGWDTSTNLSQPGVIVVDYQTDAAYLYPLLANDDTLLMTIVRDPLVDLENEDDTPEIGGRYHSTLIEWMKYKTFSGEDTDLFDEKKAGIALKRFEDEFGTTLGAINERYGFEHYDDEGER